MRLTGSGAPSRVRSMVSARSASRAWPSVPRRIDSPSGPNRAPNGWPSTSCSVNPSSASAARLNVRISPSMFTAMSALAMLSSTWLRNRSLRRRSWYSRAFSTIGATDSAIDSSSVTSEPPSGGAPRRRAMPITPSSGISSHLRQPRWRSSRSAAQLSALVPGGGASTCASPRMQRAPHSSCGSASGSTVWLCWSGTYAVDASSSSTSSSGCPAGRSAGGWRCAAWCTTVRLSHSARASVPESPIIGSSRLQLCSRSPWAWVQVPSSLPVARLISSRKPSWNPNARHR